MYAVVLMVHSVIRWLVLLALVARVGRAMQGSVSTVAWGSADRGLSGIALGLTHLQVVLGLGLFALSPKVSSALGDMGAAMGQSMLRFWAVEHPTSMILGAVAVQLGYSLSKRASTDSGRHRAALTGYGVGLLLILAGIPWAMRGEL